MEFEVENNRPGPVAPKYYARISSLCKPCAACTLGQGGVVSENRFWNGGGGNLLEQAVGLFLH